MDTYHIKVNNQKHTSTPPMCRTACTEPQCLYKGDLYLYLLNSDELFVNTFSDNNVAILCSIYLLYYVC
jgi:hypothetical protein